MRIDELLDDPRRREQAAMPEADALTETDALQEAQLLDVRLDALRSTVWLLFDCRGALQIQMGNTAVIVAYGLHRLSWVGQPRGRLTAWTVVRSTPVARDGVWSLSLGFVPSGGLELEADSSEFFVGNVPGCDEAPPNYTEKDDATIRAGLPGWTSTFEPVHAVFLGPAPSDGGLIGWRALLALKRQTRRGPSDSRRPMTPVENRLYGLAEMLRSRYDPQYATTFASFVAAGEPVVGLEILSDQLLDDEVWIAPAVFQEIEELSRLTGLKQRYWEQLRGRVRDRPGGAPDPSDAS
jgi:hypothetical protein